MQQTVVPRMSYGAEGPADPWNVCLPVYKVWACIPPLASFCSLNHSGWRMLKHVLSKGQTSAASLVVTWALPWWEGLPCADCSCGVCVCSRVWFNDTPLWARNQTWILPLLQTWTHLGLCQTPQPHQTLLQKFLGGAVARLTSCLVFD